MPLPDLQQKCFSKIVVWYSGSGVLVLKKLIGHLPEPPTLVVVKLFKVEMLFLCFLKIGWMTPSQAPWTCVSSDSFRPVRAAHQPKL